MNNVDFIVEASRTIADTAHTDALTTTDDPALTYNISIKVLTYYIENLLLYSLNAYKSDKKVTTNEEKYKYTKEHYFITKGDVQEAISRGFENAFKINTGKDVEYYCGINPVPEAINKLPY